MLFIVLITSINVYANDMKKFTKEENAEYIYNFLSSTGWSDNAIFALLGNADCESKLNPDCWQNNRGNENLGYGLVQWTPAKNYFDWCDKMNFKCDEISTQLIRLEYEKNKEKQWIKTKSYNLSMYEFSKSHLDVEYLTSCFCYNYERPKIKNVNERINLALKWKEYFSK